MPGGHDIRLRPYQARALEECRRAVAGGARSVVLVAPTGSGKTVVGAAIARGSVSRGKRVLWLAHRRELITQAADTLTTLGLRVGVVSATATQRPDPSAPVQVASIQTLLAREARPTADLVIFDEAHHAASDTYSDLVRHYAGEITLGLTATPERGDGRGLGETFRALVVAATVKELTELRALVPCEIIAPDRQLSPGQIAQRPVDAYRAHGGGRPALVFSPSLMMAEQHAQEFNAAGFAAVMVEGATPTAERIDALARFRAGALPVLVNVGVLTEGTDLPNAAVCILARGCGTTGLYIQMAGRVLRPSPGKASATLIDLRGVSHTHGHPADDREYSLDGRGIRKAGVDETMQTYCRVCGAPVSTGEGCEECGAEPKTQKPLVVTGARLQKFQRWARHDDDDRVRYLAWKLSEARRHGRKPQWAYYAYQYRYRTMPPMNVIVAAAARVAA